MKTAHSRVVWYPVCWYVCNTSSQTFAVSQVSSTTVKVVAADPATTTAAVAADITTTTATVSADPATTSTAAVLTTSSMKFVIFLWASLLVCCSCYRPNGNSSSGINSVSNININNINNNNKNMSFVQARTIVSTCSTLGNSSSCESVDAQRVCLGLLKNVSRDIRVRIEAHIKNSTKAAKLNCPSQSVYRTILEAMFKEAKAQIPFSCKSVRKLELILLPISNLTSDQKNKMAAFLELQKYYCNEEYHFNVVYNYYMKVIEKCDAMGTNACESNQAQLVCTERLEGNVPGYIPSNIRHGIQKFIKENAGGSCHGTKATIKFKENLRNLFTKVNAAMPPNCHTIEAIEKVTNTSNFGLDRTQMRSVLGYLENSKQGCQEVDKQQDFYDYYKSITGECKPIGRPSHPCEEVAAQLVCLERLDLGHDHNNVKQRLNTDITRSFPGWGTNCTAIELYKVPLQIIFSLSDVSLPLTCTGLTALGKENNKDKPFEGLQPTRRLNAFILDKQLTMGCSIR